MAIPLTINGATFEYPVNFDEDWGIDATGWAQAVTNGMLQRAGGNFPLLADVNFGATFGLVSVYYKSRSSNIATTGTMRLASADPGVVFRNNANSGNLVITTDVSDNLLYNGHILSSSGSGTVLSITGTANQIIASSPSGNVVLSTSQDIAPASSPTFASLTLTSPLTVANGGTGKSSLTAYAVLTGGTSPTNPIQSVASVGSIGQVLTSNGAGALPTFQNTTGSGTVNSGTANQLAYYATTSAAVSGLTAITASRALASDTNGLPVASTTTATELGFVSGVTSSIQTQINNISAALPPTGSITMYGAASAPSGWLLCDGSSHATASFPALFAIIGYTFGGAGANFNVPNMTNNVPVGAGSIAALGATAGTQTHIISSSELPTHNHTANVSDPGHRHSFSAYGVAGGSAEVTLTSNANTGAAFNNYSASLVSGVQSATTGISVTTTNTGSSSAMSLVQPSIGITYIIKT